MNFSLIICTYQRPESLNALIQTLFCQSLEPNEILIIDGSEDDRTKNLISDLQKNNIKYIKVDEVDRGLTRQRNIGVSSLNEECEVVCFLDDDVLLDRSYFEHIIKTYQDFPETVGVGGYITNEVKWEEGIIKGNRYFKKDHFYRKEPARFRMRALFGLAPDRPPCFLPSFGHGRSVSFLPPSGKTYEVEHFMGGVASYRKEVFERIQFSSYFEGYGLYEDADFCFRLNRLGPLYVNTSARLEHHHAASGRPNWFKYGQMVIKNGWYVWRVRYPHPKFMAVIKWRLCSLLLIGLTFSRPSKKAIAEGMGRLWTWMILFISKPKIEL